MTCAKLMVGCVLILPDGRTYTGTNACKTPQVECPRLPGEGYPKCKTVCNQTGHAETQAIAAAQGASLTGAVAYVSHPSYVCQHCQDSLQAAGIHKFVLIP